MAGLLRKLRWSGPGARGFVLGLVAAGVGAGVVGLGVILTGSFDAGASTPHGPLMAWATHAAMVRWVQREAREPAAPMAFTAQQVQAGFRDYDTACVACHGAPGVNRADWVKGLNPTPPYLLDSARHFTPAELHVVVGRGIKMTAMPAWSFTRTDAQVWDLVAFLEALPDITPAQYARMRQAAPPAPAVAP